MDDILIVTDQLHSWGAAVRYAASLAAHVRAQLTATYHLAPLSSVYDWVPAEMASEIVALRRARNANALQAGSAFARWAADRGVPACAWHVAEGTSGEVLAAAADWHDLLVIERSMATPWTLAGRLLLAVDVPCLVLPSAFDQLRFDTIAVAWDGSLCATRALHAALPLLRRAGRIVLIDGTCSQSAAGEADVDPYLREHGLGFERLRVGAGNAYVGEEILMAAETTADLLVMGARGRARLGEWTLGATTRHVLEHAHIPVLLRH